MLHYTVLYHTVLYYTVLHYTVPYCTVLHYTIPCYTVSFHNFKSQKFKSSVSNPENKYVAYFVRTVSNFKLPGSRPQNKHEILKTDRTVLHYTIPCNYIIYRNRYCYYSNNTSNTILIIPNIIYSDIIIDTIPYRHIIIILYRAIGIAAPPALSHCRSPGADQAAGDHRNDSDYSLNYSCCIIAIIAYIIAIIYICVCVCIYIYIYISIIVTQSIRI